MTVEGVSYILLGKAQKNPSYCISLPISLSVPEERAFVVFKDNFMLFHLPHFEDFEKFAAGKFKEIIKSITPKYAICSLNLEEQRKAKDKMKQK